MQLDILFLDIDGVLNSNKSRRSAGFDPECVAQFKRFFEARPETRIVFSTTWRVGFPLFGLGWLWHEHGLPLRAVIGRTPDLTNKVRGQEIQQWLQEAPARQTGCAIRRYAVLDDELDPIMGWVPRKNIFRCDCNDGLTTAIASRLIEHFEI